MCIRDSLQGVGHTRLSLEREKGGTHPQPGFFVSRESSVFRQAARGAGRVGFRDDPDELPRLEICACTCQLHVQRAGKEAYPRYDHGAALRGPVDESEPQRDRDDEGGAPE